MRTIESFWDEPKGEKLAPRLVELISMLSSGRRYTTTELAEFFGVDPRTIRRDLNERLVGFVERDSNNNYFIPASLLSKLTTKEFRELANRSGIGDLYPELSNRFITHLLEENAGDIYQVEGYHYENNQAYRSLFQKLSGAIEVCKTIKFIYKGKNYADVQPYRLKNVNGSWYLMAIDHGKIKSYSLPKIECAIVQTEYFIKDESLDKEIKENCGVWISNHKMRVILQVDAEVAGYFKSKSLLPNQKIEETYKDGSLKVQSLIHHSKEIVPLVKYWMPHIRVISPASIQEHVMKDLMAYQILNNKS